MRIGLAQIRFPGSLDDGIERVERMLEEAQANGCDLVCFPESVLPGLRGVGHPVEKYDHARQQEAITRIQDRAKRCQVTVILPVEWKEQDRMYLVALVISENGEIMGMQTKNQLDPSEDQGYAKGTRRQLFTCKGVPFGIVICHEGWRYPETVRWAAQRGANIVFHPQYTGEVDNPAFYNGAMLCRSMENTIYFASVNYAMDRQGSATTLVSPSGEVVGALSLGEEALLVADIDPCIATGLLANRFDSHRFE